MNERTEYIPCIYEKLFKKLLVNSGILSEKTWKRRIGEMLILYILIIAIFNVSISLLDEYILNIEPYKYAVFSLATLVAWPYIIILDSELFYDKYNKIRKLFKKDYYEWYSISANECFGIDDGYSNFHWSTITIFVLLILNILFYIMNMYRIKVAFNLMVKIVSTPIVLIVLPLLGLLLTLFNDKNKNLNTIGLVMLSGYSYYFYITQFSTHGIAPLFKKDFVAGQVFIILAIGIVFFIAGTTIYPMLGMINVFFTSKFEEKIKMPIGYVTETVNALKEIQKYFIHLTVINIVACFQLLTSVYLLGLLQSKLTIFLFIAGSLFPLTMYLSQDFLYRSLIEKIYIKQANIIDDRIFDIQNKEPFDGGAIQGLVALKQMYDVEFDFHHTRNFDILIAVISPIVTAILALIFPGVIG